MTEPPSELAPRLEMLIVLQWLDEGRRRDGRVALSVTTAARELGLETDRGGVLAVLAALSELEERRVVEVELVGPGRADPIVTLSRPMRREADRLFGG